VAHNPVATTSQGGLRAAAWFVRLPAMATTFVVLLLGIASGAPRVDAPVLMVLLGVGLAYHLFAYITNDLRDLPIDRTDPRRAISPLVRGTVRPWQALGIALAQVPVAVILTVGLRASARAWAALAAAFCLMAAYNLWGKRAPFPPLTDLVQGLGWGALALYGAAIAGRWTVLTGAVFGFVVVLIVMANGVHGSLRDLVNDHRHGVRSTALVMGARPDDSGRLQLPGCISVYAFTLQAILTGIVLAPLIFNQVGYRTVVRLSTLAVVLTLSAVALWLLKAAASVGDAQSLRSAGTLQLTVTLILPIALTAPSVDRPLLVILVAGFVTPLLFLSWLPTALCWGWDAARDATSGLLRREVTGEAALRLGGGEPVMPTRRRRTLLIDVAWLIRVPNCLAVAAATALGAYLAGGARSLGTGLVVRASMVAALIHAAGNVFNDLMDMRIDLVNRPSRPLPSGRMSVASATALAATTAAAGLGLALSMGPALAGLAAALAVLAFGYSYRLKDSVLLGNATVAFLASSTIAYGSLAAGGLNQAVGVASGLTFLYMLAFEVLKSIEDWEGDAAAGLWTVAGLGRRASLRIFQLIAAAFAIGAVSPWLVGFASDRYLLAVVVGAIGPLLGVATLLGRHATAQSIHVSLGITKAAWPLGLCAMALLR
jgi:4-hydroxybenzoate polyprenyltransferase